MDTQEARHVLAECLKECRTLPYSELKKRVNEFEAKEITTPSGTKYQITIQILRVEKTKEQLRILGTVDDDGWRTFCPLTEEFDRTPNDRPNK